MEQETSIINTTTRNEKIKNFLLNNKKKIIIFFIFIFLVIIGFFGYEEIKKRSKIKIANQFNNSKLNFNSGNTTDIENEMVKIVYFKDKTYSPLALFFLLDNEIINEKEKINKLFDIVINETKLDKEIKNLIIFKKALYSAEFETENNLIKMLNPIINSDSIWKSHALYLAGEYFLSKNEKKKSKEFFEKILTLKNGNSKIKLDAQKRIQSDFSK